MRDWLFKSSNTSIVCLIYFSSKNSLINQPTPTISVDQTMQPTPPPPLPVTVTVPNMFLALPATTWLVALWDPIIPPKSCLMFDDSSSQCHFLTTTAMTKPFKDANVNFSQLW